MNPQEQVIRAIFQKAATHEPLVGFRRGPDHEETSPETSYSFCNAEGNRHICFDVVPDSDPEHPEDHPDGFVWCYMVEGKYPNPFGWTHWGRVRTMEQFEACWAFLEGADMPPSPEE